MEKKEYLTPDAEIVLLNMAVNLLAGSFDEGDEEFTPGEGGGGQPV